MTRTNILGAQSGGGIGTASWTSGSGTLTAGQQTWIVVGANSGTSVTATNLTISDSHSNSYTSKMTQSFTAGQSGSVMAFRVWTGACTTGGSTTFTVDCGADSVDEYNIAVFQYDNSDGTIGATGSTSSTGVPDGAQSFSLSGAPASTSEVIGFWQWDFNNGTCTHTPGSGYTEQYDLATSGHSTIEVETRTGSTSTTVDLVDANDGGGGALDGQGAIAFEITATSGTTGSSAQTLANYTAAASGTINSPNGILYVKEVGFVTNTTGATTSAITVAAGGVPAGDTIVIYAAHDNSGTNGAVQTITVDDNSSQSGSANTYTVQTPHGIADPGAANAGQEGWFAVCNVTRALLASDTITIHYAASTTAKTIIAEQFTGVNQTTPVLASSYNHTDNETAQSVSVATGAGPTRNGQVVCALVAVEGGTADAFTQDTDTTDGSWVALTRRGSGTTTSGSTLNAVYKYIQNTGTPTTPQTYNHATMLGTSRDHCDAILVLDIVPTSGTSAQTLAAYTASASGTVTGGSGNAGTVAVTLANYTTTTTATETITGTVAVTLAAYTTTTTGTITNFITGTAAPVLANFTGFGSTPLSFATAVSSNGLYLVDQFNLPYFIHAEAPHLIIQQTAADQETWLADRQAKGVNAIWCHLIANNRISAELDTHGTNANGHAPFTGDVISTPNSAYWADVDNFFDLAQQYGFTLIAAPCDNISYGPTWAALSDADATGYGTFIGNRYKDKLNVIWIFGEDFDSSQWTARRPKYLKTLDGMQAAGDSHLVTVELTEFETTWDDSNWDSRSDIVFQYWYGLTYIPAKSAYQDAGGPKPTIRGEGNYEGESLKGFTTTSAHMRREEWWPITYGSCGHIYGTKWWQFQLNWDSNLNTTAVQHQEIIASGFQTLTGWQNLVPDFSHVFLTGGRGTEATSNVTNPTSGTGTDYATAAYINAGTLGVIYFPTSRGSITVDTTKLAGSVSAYWLDPTDGSTTVESSPATPTHPGNNAAGDTDWVLVLNGTGGATGTVAVTLANFTSSATGTETITGTVAVTLAAYTSSASGTETFTGSSAQTLANFTGAATGTDSNTGTVAVTLADYTGAATGSETITGSAATSTAAFTSSASGSEQISGTEASTLAAFTSSATGVEGITGTEASTLANYTGSASGTETITGTVAVTLAGFTCSASGAVANPVTGTVAVTLDNFTCAAFEGTGAFGSASPTLANYTGAASGTETITGTVAPTLAAFTTTTTATETITGSGAPTLANFTASAAGSEGVTGTSAQTLTNYTSTGIATEKITGTAHPTLDDDTTTTTAIESALATCATILANYSASASGTILNPTVGTVAVTLAAAVCAASGLITANVTGTAAIILQNYITQAFGVGGTTDITGPGVLRDLGPSPRLRILS